VRWPILTEAKAKSPVRAALVSVDFGKSDAKASLEELKLLARSAGAEPVVIVTGRRVAPDAALFIGSGKAEELRALVVENAVELVMFDHVLSPAQSGASVADFGD